MSRFLEDFAEFIKNNDGRVFSVAEIIGNENPEKIIGFTHFLDFFDRCAINQFASSAAGSAN